jgi:hypothetical protein
MLFGGIGVWVLAAVSLAIFGIRKPSVQPSGVCP